MERTDFQPVSRKKGRPEEPVTGIETVVNLSGSPKETISVGATRKQREHQLRRMKHAQVRSSVHRGSGRRTAHTIRLREDALLTTLSRTVVRLRIQSATIRDVAIGPSASKRATTIAVRARDVARRD